MSAENNPSSLDQEIIKSFSIQCEKCGNFIEVPIRKADINSAIGGIFRIVAIHQCNKDRVALFLFFDKYLTLRQKVVSQVTVTDLQDGAILDRETLIPVKRFASFKFLYKKLGDELAKVIFSVLTGQQIIFTGDKTEVEPSVDAMTLFTPHRMVITRSWIEESSDADIVGTTKQMAEKYWESLKVNLSTKKITNGVENEVCLQFIKKLADFTDPEKANEFIKTEISRFQSYIQEYSSVQSVNEAETFYTALALDGVDQSLLEIILPLSAQINPYIAEYYRLEQLKNEKGAPAPNIPYQIWLYDKATHKSSFINFIGKRDFIHFRDRTIVQRLQRICEKGPDTEEFFEFVTPMYYFLVLIKNKQIIALQYYRINHMEQAFHQALEIFDVLMEDDFTLKNFQIDKIKQKLEPIFSSGENKSKNFPPFTTSLKTMRESLPILDEHSILERHYIESVASDRDLRLVITKVIEKFSTEFPALQPKIVRTQKLNIIKETIMDLIANEINVHDKVDISFNILFYTHTKELNNRLDIALEFFIRPSFYECALETNLAFSLVYNKFVTIITKALEDCLKSKDFIGLQSKKS